MNSTGRALLEGWPAPASHWAAARKGTKLRVFVGIKSQQSSHKAQWLEQNRSYLSHPQQSGARVEAHSVGVPASSLPWCHRSWGVPLTRMVKTVSQAVRTAASGRKEWEGQSRAGPGAGGSPARTQSPVRTAGKRHYSGSHVPS